MSWGQDFLQGFFQNSTLKDYSHASKTFLTNGYELAPRQKFLFHVYFNINTLEIPYLKNVFGTTSNDLTVVGRLVKTIQLPNYQVTVDTLNQYNRKRLVQTKIEYNPVRVEFHDDGGDIVRNMWYNYFAYYYKDPSQQYDNSTVTNGSMGTDGMTPVGFNYNARDIYDNYRSVNDWGFIGESYSDGFVGQTPSQGKPPFFRDIRIYGFDQHKFATYLLVNPMITDWSHDTYDYSQGAGVMGHTMTIRYETVKYYSGAIGAVRPDTNAIGFADPASYDNVRSSLARPGSTATILGQGGVLDTGIGIYEDLQSGGVAGAIGAIQKAGTLYNTFKNQNIRSIVNQEARNVATQTIRQSLPGAVRSVIGSTQINPATGKPYSGSLDGLFFPNGTAR